MNYTSEEQNLIVLSSISAITYRERYAALSALASGTPDFSLCKNLLIKRCGVGVYNKVVDTFNDCSFRDGVFKELEKRNVQCVTLASPDYPELLKQIDSPPINLFIKGNRELLKSRFFSIVGSRRTNYYALAECGKFARALSGAFTLVTGSATGADCAVLNGVGGRAVSVIAHGFDSIDFISERSTLEKVEKYGLLISEHYPTVVPQSFLYPVRNRIIAGMSVGTLVVSAGKKSGALITADYASEYGREVFAFPYNLGVTSGVGCNNLIRDGANLCGDPLDICSVLGVDLKPSSETSLTEEERKVAAILKEQGEVFIPKLSETLKIPTYKLTAVLSSLEIKGLATRLGGNRYGAV